MKKALVIVDMQNDFTTGALKNDSATAIIDDILAYAKQFDGEVIFTKDTHTDDYMTTQEGKNLPVAHCIRGTEGWEIAGALKAFSEGKKIVEKPTFGSVELATYLKQETEMENDPLKEVEFVGTCTGICVISNAMLAKAFCPELVVKVHDKMCACLSEDSHQTALQAMKLCQIQIV